MSFFLIGWDDAYTISVALQGFIRSLPSPCLNEDGELVAGSYEDYRELREHLQMSKDHIFPLLSAYDKLNLGKSSSSDIDSDSAADNVVDEVIVELPSSQLAGGVEDLSSTQKDSSSSVADASLVPDKAPEVPAADAPAAQFRSDLPFQLGYTGPKLQMVDTHFGCKCRPRELL